MLRELTNSEIPERWGGLAYLRAVLEFLVCARDLSRADSCFAGFVGVVAIGRWVLDLGKRTWMDLMVHSWACL